ncbi:MAG: roadblock/LC7 domain-containing protein [Gemmatimonadota bacterium]|nr:roadblock/LC7 domain-containing protein [Gemmatimonadota bacterium]MDH4349853.1 roadblock/LC7 domain-containing protein [Gemmatimonadota bacterium]MDH5196225.1 roadblock/LC7 domain-containing protein [Gemmatimonadota bacterium]
MNPERMYDALDRITRVRGVRGAMVVSAEDGLVVGEAVMEGVRGNAVAALAASLAARLGRAAGAAEAGAQRFVHLQAEVGAMLLMPGADGLVIVAVTDQHVNVGLVRLEMQRMVEDIA